MAALTSRIAAAARIFAAALLLSPLVANAQTAFAPAAIVNDDIVTYFDVEQRAALLQITGARPGPELNRAALEGLVDDRLRLQAGERFELSASEEALTAGIEEFGQRLGVEPGTLLVRLQEVGISETALRDFIAPQIVWRDLVNGRFGSRATPSELELDMEIELAASGEVRSYRLSEIALPTGQGREQQARDVMQRVLSELNSGADFATLARRYSRTPSAQNGGDVGWVPETALPPDLAQLIASTPPGSVTEPFEVPGGLSVYKVADTRSEAPPWAAEAQLSMRRITIDDDSVEAITQANELREGIAGCESIPDLSDQMTMQSIDNVIVSALPGPISDAVKLLQSGQASRPVKTEGKTEVFVVCDRSGGVDAETRAQLREQIRNRRLGRLAEGYLQELRREAVIERR